MKLTLVFIFVFAVLAGVLQRLDRIARAEERLAEAAEAQVRETSNLARAAWAQNYWMGHWCVDPE